MSPKTSQLFIALAGALALAVASAAYFNSNRLPAASAASNSGVATTANRGVPERMTVPSGTRLDVRLDQAVSSKSAPGSEFLATVSEPVVVNGVTVIPRGARAHGTIVSARPSGRLKGVAHLSLALNAVETGGRSYGITTTTFGQRGKSHKKRNWIAIGGTSGAGALIGGLAAGPAGMLIGSGAGAGAGTGYAYATGKKDIFLPVESRVSFSLREPAEIAVR